MLVALVVVPATLIVGTIVGLLLNRLGKKMSVFVSTAALMAWATPPDLGGRAVLLAGQPGRRRRRLGAVQDAALAGRQLQLGRSTTGPRTDALQAYIVIALLVVWQSFPFIAVSVLAGLKTIPGELLEAAGSTARARGGCSGRSPSRC